MLDQTLILTHQEVEQKLNRLAYEILENHFEEKEIVMIGIEGKGSAIATKLEKKLSEISKLKIASHTLSLDKDEPLKSGVSISGNPSLDGKTVLLVDDVLNTGKTLVFAVRHILNDDVKQLHTVILVDRKHRNYPVRADLVGLTLATTMKEHISVNVKGSKLEVYLS